MILVDLDAPASASSDDLREVLTRWAQQTRFASVLAVDGLRAGDARGLVIDASVDSVIAFFKALAQAST